MNKWEYARLESTTKGVNVVFSHREAWTEIAPDAFFDTLRRLGDEGWELVSAMPLAAAADFESDSRSHPGGPSLQRMRLRLDTDRWLVFKRPQPTEPEKSSQTDIVRDLVQRQLLKGRLPLP